MTNRPNPDDYRRKSISPTNMLNENFRIMSIEQTQYEGEKQLLVEIVKESDGSEYDLYVSNRAVMSFLEDIAETEFLNDALYFYKSSPNQRYYEIAWVE